ncbi:RluA family pseudouridine synthase [Pontiellaceae bacterium B12227]|nr:RluA family pseudouridine synthase [Pontiellaceae bacterium B12227]
MKRSTPFAWSIKRMIVRETHLVPDDTNAMRLSDYARTVFEPLLSRKGISKALKRGEFRINGKPAHSGDWVEAGQLIELMDLQQRAPKTYPLPLDVVFEDDDLAVINKPPGIEVSGNKFKTVENALSANLAPSPKPDALPWPRPVHRLDYSTSGLLLIAKTASAQRLLGQAFEARRVHKRYCAVVMGEVPISGTIEAPIDGLPCRSEYEPVYSVPSLRSGRLTLVHLFPITGRTHQLRIHMAGIGHPIVGDPKYGEDGNTLKGKGLFLASIGLRFPHPGTQQELNLSIAAPPKFNALMEREQGRWDKFNP